MTTPQLKLFTELALSGRLDRLILTNLLERFKTSLPPEAAALLTAELDFEQFCAAWAAQFRSAGAFGAPLLQALVEIETLALPENRLLLDSALAELPSNWINRNFPLLQQATHLWLLAQGNHGVTWPLRSGSPFNVQSSSQSTIENQYSKIEKPATFNLQPATPESGSPFKVQGSVFDVQCSPSPAPVEVQCSTPTENPSQSKIESSPFEVQGSVFKVQCSTPTENPENSKLKIQNSKLDAPPEETPEESFLRLARLSPVEYDLVRRAEAKRLHLRLPTLDDAVDRARSLQDDADAISVPLSHLEPWPEPILDPSALFDEVHDRYLHYAYLPNGAAVVLALWPGHAHAINAFALTPRIHLTSRKEGCGKSTVLSLLATFCPRVLRTDNLKPAVLYRTGPRQPTMVLDEVDTYLHRQPELGGLLNASNDIDACVYRCEGHAVIGFKAYVAIALASIGPLGPTLRDRSIVIPMEEAPVGYAKTRFDKRHLEAETILGRKIARWAKDNFAAIAACDPVMPPEAYNRLGDKWRPLFAIAQVIGGHWPARVLESFKHLTAKPADHQLSTINHQLLSDIRVIFAQTGAARLFSSALVDSLCALPARPWSGTNNGDKPLTTANLARRLHTFGIGSHTMRIGSDQAKGYDLADFTNAFARILDKQA